ncbi:MAG: 50S ribosomal protein L3 [Candidatus Nanohaloarchaea archaeon]|nr:50S ribosomal protein L3 [Candidatus Nanohaloarchaea archaeon]
MADKNHPRRGSLQYKPHKRASRLHPKFRKVDTGQKGIQGFAGYKTGMTRVLRIEDRKNSEQKGQEVADAVTVLECPPIQVYGVRLYRETPRGIEVMKDLMIAENQAEEQLSRTVELPDKKHEMEGLEEDSIAEVSLLAHTQPYLTSNGRKKPETFEIPVQGSVKEQLEKAKEKRGEEIKISELFDEGQYLDAVGITKGKGIEGPVKRHGVKPLPRKTQKISRKAGNLGPWHPDHTSWRVPQAGQKGNARRTEYNKRLLKIGEDPEEVNPEGGFKKYGEVKNEYALVKGSVPGPSKRLIMLRPAVRKDSYPENPEIRHIQR